MSRNPASATLLLAVVIAMGCQPEPSLYEVAVPEGKAIVAAPQRRNPYRWPVTDDEWQATRPTEYSFLRQMEPGSLGKRAEAMETRNRQRIEEAANSGGPAPWEVASSPLKGEAATVARLCLGEIDGKPSKRFSVAIPSEIQQPTVALDKTARRLVIGGQNGVWISRLPWRPWHAVAGSPATPEDEPGDADQFTQVDLPFQPSSGAPLIRFFGKHPKGEESRCVVSFGQHLAVIDCVNQTVLASKTFDRPLIHLSVAMDDGQMLVVDSDGNLSATDASLERLVSIDQVDIDLPLPEISPDGNLIAAYVDQDSGRVFQMKNGSLIGSLRVVFRFTTEPKMIRCSDYHLNWLDQDAVHSISIDETRGGTDLVASRKSLYWDVREVHDAKRPNGDYGQVVIAERPRGDGTSERVICDMKLGSGRFSAPTSLESFDGKTLCCAASGNFIAFSDTETIDVYARPRNVSRSADLGADVSRIWFRQRRFADLEAYYSLLRALPEPRFNQSKEVLTGEFIEAIAAEWLAFANANERGQETLYGYSVPDVHRSIQEWVDSDSPLSLVTRVEYHAEKAWDARGSGYSASVSQQGWQVFKDEYDKAATLWSEIEKLDDIPAKSYDNYVTIVRDASLEIGTIGQGLEAFLDRYPTDTNPYHNVMLTKMEKWGGSQGSSAAFAGAIADGIGGPQGDFVYMNCIRDVQNHYSFAYFRYARVNANRVLAGVRYALENELMNNTDVLTTIQMLCDSHSQPSTPGASSGYARNATQLSEDLTDYYKMRYPMLASWCRNNRRFHLVVRYLPE